MLFHFVLVLVSVSCYVSLTAPVGRRGWKMFFAVVKDLVLYLHKDEHAFRKSAFYDNMGNAIRYAMTSASAARHSMSYR